jgi:sporulation protein YlmC with PRC-barrel domain
VREVRVELLLGKQVVDRVGRRVGRIEELIATRRDGACMLREVHLGPYALVERLALSASRLPFLGLLARVGRFHRVPWDRIDLSDPAHPRLTCRLDEIG